HLLARGWRNGDLGAHGYDVGVPGNRHRRIRADGISGFELDWRQEREKPCRREQMAMSFPEAHSDPFQQFAAVPPELGESPRHGFQGDRAPVSRRSEVPASLTIALSREAGSRGSTIAARAGQKLGWQVYTQELLEYVAQEGAFRQDILH